MKTNLLARLSKRPSQRQWMDKRAIMLDQFGAMKRMKTVFCHADHSTDEVSSVFNLLFDRTGRFLVSGADDG